MAGAWLAVLVLIMGGIARTPDDGVLRAAVDPAIALNLRLTAADSLPASSKRALISEADSIWKHARIRLKWLSGGAAAADGLTLRVLVMPQTVAASGEEPWAVGELLRFEGSHAIAIASIAGARRVVDESQRFQILDLPALHDYRLGLVLGRAVAHEIGHYLLQTNVHSEHGLMRATIDAREFADPHAMTFRLDEEARARLAEVAARR